MQKIVLACVYLHNFLRKSDFSRNGYTPQGTFDSETNGNGNSGRWRNETSSTSSFLPLKKIARKSTFIYEDTRKIFAEYFRDVGKVSWQELYE